MCRYQWPPPCGSQFRGMRQHLAGGRGEINAGNDRGEIFHGMTLSAGIRQNSTAGDPSPAPYVIAERFDIASRVISDVDMCMLPPSIPHSILFVCLGNICRSPAAEIIFSQQAENAGLAHCFYIDSAGTTGHHVGSPPDPRMAEALHRRGYLVTGRSCKIRPEDLQNYDLIVTMDESIFADVRRLDPEGRFHHKIRPFTSFCHHHSDSCVPDPYYGGLQGFDHVISLIEDGCEGMLTEFGGAAATTAGIDFQLAC